MDRQYLRSAAVGQREGRVSGKALGGGNGERFTGIHDRRAFVCREEIAWPQDFFRDRLRALLSRLTFVPKGDDYARLKVNNSMDLDAAVKVAVYRTTAETGKIPAIEEVAEKVGASESKIRESYARLRATRLLWLEDDGVTIRMAPPFSGVPTQHRVTVGEIDYFANCAWDALGILAALHRSGVVHSRCEQSLEPLRLSVGLNGPEASTWLFHCLVPAAKWWDDLVFT